MTLEDDLKDAIVQAFNLKNVPADKAKETLALSITHAIEVYVKSTINQVVTDIQKNNLPSSVTVESNKVAIPGFSSPAPLTISNIITLLQSYIL